MENKEKKSTYLSVLELAKILGVSRITVFNRIKKGQIPAEKIGHSYAIPRDQVAGLLEGKDDQVLSDKKKEVITEAVAKAVKDYGETLRLLGQE